MTKLSPLHALPLAVQLAQPALVDITVLHLASDPVQSKITSTVTASETGQAGRDRLTGTTLDFAEPGRESLDLPTPFTNDPTPTYTPRARTITLALLRVVSRAQSYLTQRHRFRVARELSPEDEEIVQRLARSPLDFEFLDKPGTDDDPDATLGGAPSSAQYADALCDSPTSELAFSFTKVNHDGDSVASSVTPPSARPRRPVLTPSAFSRNYDLPYIALEYDAPEPVSFDYGDAASTRDGESVLKPDKLQALVCGRRSRATIHVPLVSALDVRPSLGFYPEWHDPQFEDQDDSHDAHESWSADSRDTVYRAAHPLGSQSSSTAS